MADFAAQQNPYEDRITAILQKRAQPIANDPTASGYAGNAAINYALSGQNRSGQMILDAINAPQLAAQDREFESTKGLYDLFEQKRAQGDKQAQALFDKVSLFTGGDPEGTAMFVEQLHADPESIDPGNSYQVMTKLAGIAKKTGYKPLDIKLKEAQIRASDALATQRQTGGSGGGSSVFSQTMSLIDNDPELSKLSTMEKLRLAQNKVGTNLMLDETGQVTEMAGAPESLGDLKYGEKFGGKFGEKQAEAVLDLPRIRNVASEALTAIDNSLKSPGLKNITGWLSLAPITPGGERARAEALLDQVGGRTFLAAYETLKGGGQISNIEGVKAEQAIATLGTAQKYEDVILALNQLRSVIVNTVKTKEQQAIQTSEQITSTPFEAPASPSEDVGIKDMTDDDILKALE